MMERQDTNQIRNLWSQTAEMAVRFREELDGKLQRPTQTYAQSLAGFEAPTPETGGDGRRLSTTWPSWLRRAFTR